MQIGILTPMDPKKYAEELKKNIDASIGIDLDSLVDEINLLEIKHAYDTSKILGELKLRLLQCQGKVEINEDGN